MTDPVLPRRCTVYLTAHFESNLEDIDAFLLDAQLPQAFDVLLDELTDTIIPNLERFPSMGRLFLEQSLRSIEIKDRVAGLIRQLGVLSEDAELREYVMAHYLLLYVQTEGSIYLLSIRHQRQLSFDLAEHWLD